MTDPNPPADGNLFLDRLCGAHVTFHHPDQYNGRRQEIIDAALDAERAAGHSPYFFPVGASVPLGCWGYIRCMAELVEQLGKDEPVDLFCATSSVGTQTGLILGKALRIQAIGHPTDHFQTTRHDSLRGYQCVTDTTKTNTHHHNHRQAESHSNVFHGLTIINRHCPATDTFDHRSLSIQGIGFT